MGNQAVFRNLCESIETGEGASDPVVELSPGQRFRVGAVELEFDAQPAPARPVSRRSSSTSVSFADFASAILRAFAYPVRKDGSMLLIAGAVAFSLCDFVGSFSFLLQIAVTGYVVAYAQKVICTSAQEQDEPPSWPELSNWRDDIVVPAISYFIMSAIFLGPAFFVIFHPVSEGIKQNALVSVACAWGIFAFPIAVLAAAMMDSMSAMLNPLPLIRAITITFPTYLFTCCVVAMIAALSVGTTYSASLVQFPVVPSLVEWFVQLYLLTVAMRSIGLFYRLNHRKLQWY